MTIVPTKETFTMSKREAMTLEVAEIIETAAMAEDEIEPYALAEQIVNAMSEADTAP